MSDQKPFAALRKGHWHEFTGNQQPKCPHCGADFDIAEREAWDLYTEETHAVECDSCKGEFQVTSSAIWSFSTDEQDDFEETDDGPGVEG